MKEPTGAPASHGWQGAIDEWRVNWRIGLAAFLSIGLSFGAYQSISSLFVLPLQEAFGWSRTEIAFAYNAAMLSAVSSPFLGRIIDRFGTRRIMLGGMAITGFVYVGMATMNGSLALYYLYCAMAAVIGLSASGLTCSRVVSQSFIRSRGFSLAVARSGLALAAAVLPPVLFAVMARYGWRAGYMVEALLVFFVALPAVYFWMGHSRSPAGAERLRAATDMPGWLALLSNRKVWYLCLAAGLGYAPATAVMSQLQPILINKGLAPGAAASLVGMAGLSSLGGAVLTGTLVDRFWAPAIALLFAAGSALGTVLLALNPTLDGPTAAAAILLIGVGLGAEIDIVAYMVARYFGVKVFSTLYGLTVFFIATSSALGASLLGVAYDRAGNYDMALLVIAAAFLSAGLVYLLLGRYPVLDNDA